MVERGVYRVGREERRGRNEISQFIIRDVTEKPTIRGGKLKSQTESCQRSWSAINQVMLKLISAFCCAADWICSKDV